MFDFDSYKKLLDECLEFNQGFEENKQWPEEDIGFLYDGPVSMENWNSQYIKILFLAKEHYGFWGCKPREKIESKDFTPLFRNRLSKLAFLMTQYYQNNKVYSEQDVKNISSVDLENSWENLALIEVKKISGESKSKDNEIREHGRRNKDFLKKQIEMLGPDIIFCCGKVVWHVLTIDTGLYDREKQNIDDYTWCYSINNKLLVHSYHPSQPGFKLYEPYKEIISFLKK